MARLLLALLLLADIIHLKNGGKLEGKVLGEKDGKIDLKIRGGGTASIPKDQIERIEYCDTTEETLEKRRKALAKEDAKGRYELALYALENKYPEVAMELLREAVALGHADAPAKLREVVDVPAGNLWRSAGRERGQKALDYLVKLVETFPESSYRDRGLLAAGDTALALGKMVVAEHYYRLALDRNSKSPAREGLVRCYISLRRWEKAAELLEEREKRDRLNRLIALEKSKKGPLELAKLYAEFGADDRAIATLDPLDSAEARRALYELHSRRRDFEAARGVAEKLGDKELLRLAQVRARYAVEIEVANLEAADRLEKLAEKANEALDGKKTAFDEPFAEIEAAIRRGEAASSYPPPNKIMAKTGKGKMFVRQIKAEYDDTEFEYLLYVPKGYTPDRRWRLLITLHGSNGDPHDQLQDWLDSVQSEKDLLLAAPAAGHGCWGNSRKGHSLVLSTMHDVMKNYRIDPNRVYLDGGSMGGFGAFYLACHYPDRWAAIGPRVGGPRTVNVMAVGPKNLSPAPEYLDNLLNVPVYWVAGDVDPRVPIDDIRAAKKRLDEIGVDLTYHERKGGHEWYDDENPAVLDFYRSHPRNPYPKRVRWASVDPLFNRAHWLEATGTTGRLAVDVTHLDNDNNHVDQRKEYADPFTIDAQIEGQTIRIKTKNVATIFVYLSDRLVDLDQEVEIIVNGKTSIKKKFKRSTEFLFAQYRRDRDREMIFSAGVSIKVE